MCRFAMIAWCITLALALLANGQAPAFRTSDTFAANQSKPDDQKPSSPVLSIPRQPSPSTPAVLRLPTPISAPVTTALVAESPEPKAPALPNDAATPPTTAELAKKLEEVSKNLTVVTSDGDFKLVLGGAVIADFLYSTKRPLSSGTPFFLSPDSPIGYNTQTFDAHARQTSLFAMFTGPDVFHLKSGGFVLVNLYDNSIVEDRYGLLPINAFGELKNDDWRIAAGFQMDIFNPVIPTVLPFSLLGASGNAGVFRSQLRLERFIHSDDDTHLTLTGGLSEPIPTTLNEELRISEDNGLPNAEARVAIGFGPMEGAGLEAHRPIEFGVSGVGGQIRTVDLEKRVVGNVWGAGFDALVTLDPRYGFKGEAYVGQGLGTYGASAMANINPATFQPIRTAGFWVEGYYYWCPDMVHTHLGYGIDDPANADAGPNNPIRNETYYATTIWDITKAFRVAFQVSYLKTAYSRLQDNEGFVFHTQFQWKF